MTEAGEHAHLAAVGLAPSSAPLPGNADRLFPLLREARLVDDQARIQSSAKLCIDSSRYLVHDGLAIPVRHRQKVVQSLGIRLGNDFGHLQHRSAPSLHQAGKILPRLREHAASPTGETKGEALGKSPELVPQILVGNWGIADLRKTRELGAQAEPRVPQ